MERRRQRVREGVDGERLAADRRSLEQCQPDERPLEPVRIRVDDPVALDAEAHQRKVAPARGIAEQLQHRSRLAALVWGRSTLFVAYASM